MAAAAECSLLLHLLPRICTDGAQDSRRRGLFLSTHRSCTGLGNILTSAAAPFLSAAAAAKSTSHSGALLLLRLLSAQNRAAAAAAAAAATCSSSATLFIHMPCCRHSAAAAASAAAATRSLLLLLLLQFLAAWPAAPPQQQQHPQRGNNSRTPHTHISHDDAWRLPRFFYASAKGCCSKTNSAAEETTAAAAESWAPAPTTTSSSSNSSSNALVGETQTNAAARSLHMNMKSVSSRQSAQGTSDEKDKNAGSGEGSGMPPCCGVMPMYFVTTTHTIILFSWWETLKAWQYWISVVVCLFLGIFSILLKVVRMHVERWLVLREAAEAAAAGRGGNTRLGGGGAQVIRETCCSSKDVGEQQEGVKGGSKGVLAGIVGVVCCRSIAGFPLRSNCCRMVQAFLLYGYDYLLMLIVMSYNVGLFFAVTGGLALGFFFFGHLLVYRHRTNSSPQQQKQNVEMHDFHAGDPLCCGA